MHAKAGCTFSLIKRKNQFKLIKEFELYENSFSLRRPLPLNTGRTRQTIAVTLRLRFVARVKNYKMDGSSGFWPMGHPIGLYNALIADRVWVVENKTSCKSALLANCMFAKMQV